MYSNARKQIALMLAILMVLTSQIVAHFGFEEYIHSVPQSVLTQDVHHSHFGHSFNNEKSTHDHGSVHHSHAEHFAHIDPFFKSIHNTDSTASDEVDCFAGLLIDQLVQFLQIEQVDVLELIPNSIQYEHVATVVYLTPFTAKGNRDPPLTA